jgi:uncharacterized membrane protein
VFARQISLYLVLLAAFLAVDALWLGVIASGFYREHLGFLLAEQPNWTAAGIFYLLFVLGIQVFVVVPGLAAGSLPRTLGRAALFGLITYATYDLTNHATVAGWPLRVTLVDLAWGAVLCTLVSLAGFLAGQRLLPRR